MKIRTLAALIAVTTITSAHAGPLDDPISAKSTPRTETKRGYERGNLPGLAWLRNQLALAAGHRFIVRRDEINGRDPQSLGEFKYSDDRGVLLATLKVAEVLLAKAGQIGKTLLGQPSGQPDLPDVPAHQPPHVHA